MSQHAGLTPERWRSFDLSQQILIIGNEMHRASDRMSPEHDERLRNCYERVLRLVDLTVAVNSGRSLRRELLRWRDLIAELYIREGSDPKAHRAALRCLLLFTPESAKQIPYVCV